MKKDAGLFLGRLLVGGIFFFSGLQKLSQPYQNFLYVIESYQVFPSVFLEFLAAQTVPWIEVCAGAFLLLGLWTRAALAVCGVMTLGFVLILGQALWRHLPLEACGCFGDALKVPPMITFGMDVVMGQIVVCLWYYRDRVDRWGLDRCFAGGGQP